MSRIRNGESRIKKLSIKFLILDSPFLILFKYVQRLGNRCNPFPARLATLGAAACLLLSGCCANNVCDCQDAQADALDLRFAAGSGAGGFRAEDLDTLLLLRFPRRYKSTSKFETVTLYRPAAQAHDSVLLNHNTPFNQTGSAKLSAYRYVVQYLKHMPGRKPVPTTVAVLDSVDLAGSFEGDGCCTCYLNSQKVVYRNGTATDLHTSAPQPNKPLVLTKP